MKPEITPDITKFDKVISMLDSLSARKKSIRHMRQACANELRDLTVDDLTHVRKSISELGYDSEFDDVLDVLFNRVYSEE